MYKRGLKKVGYIIHKQTKKKMTTSEVENEFGLKPNENHLCAKWVQQLNGDEWKRKGKPNKYYLYNLHLNIQKCRITRM